MTARSRIFPLLVVVACAWGAQACSEATDGASAPGFAASPTDASTVAPGADGGSGRGTNDGSVGRDSASPSEGGPAPTSALLVNEISASAEWVELVNAGAAALDVSGYKVADRAKDGTPKLAEAAVLPPGTVLSPKAYLIVQGGGLDGGVGKPCPSGGQSYCVNAAFGVSNKNGETLFVLDTGDQVLESAEYPPDAAASGSSWGRVPNADPAAAFQVTKPTPGAANAP